MKQTENTPQVVYLDFDRTLCDTPLIMERFYAVAASFGITVDAIQKAQQETESDGGTFEPLTLLEKLLNPTQLQRFFKQFITDTSHPVLYPDVDIFLKLLKQNNIPYHVITYGVSAAWQELKIKASGYRGEYTIMDHADKGAFIAASISNDNKYIMPGKDNTLVAANTACLIDDKAVAFTSLPKNCSGFMMQRNNTLLPSQRGELPAHVERITSLSDLRVHNSHLKVKVAN